ISAPLGFDFVLIGFCTLYAIKTRNVPENFNEAKFIGFTMYTTLVIWIAFVPIYYNSDENVITLSLCISFSAIVALVLLFFPKLYIILFKPEKNNRSYFTTAKNVRCHIGYMQSNQPPSSQTYHYQQQQYRKSHQTSPSRMIGSNQELDDSQDETDRFRIESETKSYSIVLMFCFNFSSPLFYIETNQAYVNRPSRRFMIVISPIPYRMMMQHRQSSSLASKSKSNELIMTQSVPMIDRSQQQQQQHQQSASKMKRGFFSRLRFSKQDKIAANVAEHIRAVRAAEALDRQTARGRRFNITSQSFSERHEDNVRHHQRLQQQKQQQQHQQSIPDNFIEDYVGLLTRQDTATRRIRIVHMLRQTFGKELEKLPQFSALVNCLKYECSHTFTEIACQTSGLNGSINVIDNINNNGVCGGLPISNEETLRRRQL
ncbi:metabotropic glutamate receptor 1-like protein 1, partial [Sarcoptes scabiei]